MTSLEMENFINCYSDNTLQQNTINVLKHEILPLQFDLPEYRSTLGMHFEDLICQLNPNYGSNNGGLKIARTKGQDAVFQRNSETPIRISIKTGKNILLKNGKTKHIIMKNMMGRFIDDVGEFDAVMVICRPDNKLVYSDVSFGICTRQDYDLLPKKNKGSQISVQFPLESFGKTFCRGRAYFQNNDGYLEKISSDFEKGHLLLMEDIRQKNLTYQKIS